MLLLLWMVNDAQTYCLWRKQLRVKLSSHFRGEFKLHAEKTKLSVKPLAGGSITTTDIQRVQREIRAGPSRIHPVCIFHQPPYF